MARAGKGRVALRSSSLHSTFTCGSVSLREEANRVSDRKRVTPVPVPGVNVGTTEGTSHPTSGPPYRPGPPSPLVPLRSEGPVGSEVRSVKGGEGPDVVRIRGE